MKKIISVLFIFILMFSFCGASAPLSNGLEVTGTNMVIRFPDDYVVIDQSKVILGDTKTADLTQEDIDMYINILRKDSYLLYAKQVDGFDNIIIDTISYADTLTIQDFTKFCNTSGLNDKELLAKLEDTTFFRGASSEPTIENYTLESSELVTINGEKYGYSIGYFDEDGVKDYVLEYNTIKNGKSIRIEMYIQGNGAPSQEQIQTLRTMMDTIGYTRGANGFMSQVILGMNGASLLPLILIGVAIIAGIIVLIIALRIHRKKHPKVKKSVPEAANNTSQPHFSNMPPQNPQMQQTNTPQEPFYQGQPHAQQGTPTQYAAPAAPQPNQQAPASPQQTQPHTQPTSQINNEQPMMPQHAAPTAPQPSQQAPASPQQTQPQAQSAPQWQPVSQQYSAPVVPEPQPTEPQQPAVQYMPPAEPMSQPQTPTQTTAPVDVMQSIEQLSELKRQGVISAEEFEFRKSELLKRL